MVERAGRAGRRRGGLPQGQANLPSRQAIPPSRVGEVARTAAGPPPACGPRARPPPYRSSAAGGSVASREGSARTSRAPGRPGFRPRAPAPPEWRRVWYLVWPSCKPQASALATRGHGARPGKWDSGTVLTRGTCQISIGPARGHSVGACAFLAYRVGAPQRNAEIGEERASFPRMRGLLTDHDGRRALLASRAAGLSGKSPFKIQHGSRSPGWAWAHLSLWPPERASR